MPSNSSTDHEVPLSTQPELVIEFPTELPISARVDDILTALQENQVIVVAGETGSGKTTQLPKICWQLGYGRNGRIGHTQPRRLAARTVAERIAEEVGSNIGDAVGFHFRFTERFGESTRILLMTDGILLTEIEHDRMLSAYEVLIIDESHERSLNVDFLLGYLKTLLPKRPDLKVIITSATIDTQKFSEHFGGAPIIEVSGRTYPVEIRYRPLVGNKINTPESLRDTATLQRNETSFEETDPSHETADMDPIEGICAAVRELSSEKLGDILVFLPGEREIRDTEKALSDLRMPTTEILPLYARQSASEQHKIFNTALPVGIRQRIVLATNVAETSLTVPGIKYVIDPGNARISRYSHRSKVQRLPVEPVSQASANQRAGRCGRTSDGICIRLYSEEDFASRPEFTDPEILRTNLASVLLRMLWLRLGKVTAQGIHDFPFIQPPDQRSIRDGVALLSELQAVQSTRAKRGSDHRLHLTEVGRRLANLPVDPRFARMILEANKLDCVQSVLVVTAGLSIQDPRERPREKQEQADQFHRRFHEPTSDFLSYVKLWNYLQELRAETSSNQFRKQCRAEFLNYLRIREWQDMYRQLESSARRLGFSVTKDRIVPGGNADTVHQALLAGLLSHIGVAHESSKDYLGARGRRFTIFPGSALFKKSPDAVMAAELVETSRLYARTVAAIDPAWAEPLAGDLAKRTYHEPHWEESRASVVAWEKVTLYGVPIVPRRNVNFGKVDPVLSRELFIRHALVEGQWKTRNEFVRRNRELLNELSEREHRARKITATFDDQALYDFYDERIPENIVSGGHFDHWWKQIKQKNPELLSLNPADLSESTHPEELYPSVWSQNGQELDLVYEFNPGADTDGVRVLIPVDKAASITEEGFDWHIPAYREELVTAWIKSLPKEYRKSCVPAPDFARKILANLTGTPEPHTGAKPPVPLLSEMSRVLREIAYIRIPYDAWNAERLPQHLRIRFALVSRRGRELLVSGNLSDITQAAQDITTQKLPTGKAQPRQSRQPSTDTPSKTPKTLEPAATSVNILTEQRAQSVADLTQKIVIATNPLVNALSPAEKLVLSQSPYPSVKALLADCIQASAAEFVQNNPDSSSDQAVTKAATEIPQQVKERLYAVLNILTRTRQLEKELSSPASLTLLPLLADVKEHLSHLVFKGFITQTPPTHFKELPRYLDGISERIARIHQSPGKDKNSMLEIHELERMFRERGGHLPLQGNEPERLAHLRWLLEELRVSLLAPATKTKASVSLKKIRSALLEINA